MAEFPKSTDSIGTKFLGFVYGEVKDLSKQFLTLLSGVLVFSVTFSEKIVGFPTVSLLAKNLLFVSWLLFIGALVATGAAIWLNYVCASMVLRGREDSAASLVPKIYYVLDLGGVGFVVGLILLAVAALVRITS